MIDPAILQQLDKVLSTSSVPNGCTALASDPDHGLSFWDSLDHASQADKLQTEFLATGDRSTAELVENLKADVVRLHTLSNTKPCPIVAVCGMLNSGKSSLIAGFLSSTGRRRVLIGRGNESGTHRFVVWLPESWRRNNLLWEAALKQIQEAFGCSGEMLSDDDVDQAHRQYNGLPLLESKPKDETLPTPPIDAKQRQSAPGHNRSRDELFRVPLVATDPQLDELSIGLMDCPDVQSGTLSGAYSDILENADVPAHSAQASFAQRIAAVADYRQKTLYSGLRIASCMILVVQSNSIRDSLMRQLIGGVRQVLPNVRCYLGINQVPKRYSVAEIAAEINLHFRQHNLDGAYMAYDFRGPNSDQTLPAAPLQWQEAANESAEYESLPIFFAVRNQAPAQVSAKLAEEDYLLAIGSQLDAGQMAIDVVNSTLSRATSRLQESRSLLDKYIATEAARTQRLHQVFAESLLRFAANGSAKEGTVRLQLSEEIILQMQASLERTAPWWAKPSRVISRWSVSLGQSAKELTDKIPGVPALGRGMQQAAQWVRTKFHKGEGGAIMTAEQLAQAIRRCDRKGDLPPAPNSSEEDQVVLTANRVIERFQKESHARLPDDQLDRFTGMIWQQMSWRQKFVTGVAPATLIFAPLVAVITVPFDFGTSHVLVFATVKELLLAGVASAGMLLIQGDQFPEIAEGEAAWKQLSDLFAITCDEFGRTRPETKQLPVLTVHNARKPLLPSATHRSNAMQSPLAPSLIYQQNFPAKLNELLVLLEKMENEL